MRVLDLFSCIGFHSLGLQRASTEFEVVALCESNPRRREELARLHPGVPIYDDVRSLPAVEADIVFGGPPCQRTSVAAAIHGHRDGASLWPYMLCASIDAGAEWIVVEQPPGNEAWEAQVYRHLSRSGYHSAKFRFGAEDVGGPYPRRRDYIIACTSLPRLEIAWQAGPSAIERAKRSADARGDWDPNSIPAFDLDTWRSEDVHERKERIEALGDSNPPAMAEVIGYMISDAMLAPTPEPILSGIEDEFNGDNPKLISCIEALIRLNDSDALIPHGIGGHARTMLSAAAVRLASAEPSAAADKLSAFLDALEEWGCENNDKRAEEILAFQRGGYDLSAYAEDRE